MAAPAIAVDRETVLNPIIKEYAGVLDRLSPLQRDVRIHRVPGRGLAAAPLLAHLGVLDPPAIDPDATP